MTNIEIAAVTTDSNLRAIEKRFGDNEGRIAIQIARRRQEGIPYLVAGYRLSGPDGLFGQTFKHYWEAQSALQALL